MSLRTTLAEHTLANPYRDEGGRFTTESQDTGGRTGGAAKGEGRLAKTAKRVAKAAGAALDLPEAETRTISADRAAVGKAIKRGIGHGVVTGLVLGRRAGLVTGAAEAVTQLSKAPKLRRTVDRALRTVSRGAINLGPKGVGQLINGLVLTGSLAYSAYQIYKGLQSLRPPGPSRQLAEPDVADRESFEAVPEVIWKALLSALKDYTKHGDGDRLQRDLAAIAPAQSELSETLQEYALANPYRDREGKFTTEAGDTGGGGRGAKTERPRARKRGLGGESVSESLKVGAATGATMAVGSAFAMPPLHAVGAGGLSGVGAAAWNIGKSPKGRAAVAKTVRTLSNGAIKIGPKAVGRILKGVSVAATLGGSAVAMHALYKAMGGGGDLLGTFRDELAKPGGPRGGPAPFSPYGGNVVKEPTYTGGGRPPDPPDPTIRRPGDTAAVEYRGKTFYGKTEDDAMNKLRRAQLPEQGAFVGDTSTIFRGTSGKPLAPGLGIVGYPKTREEAAARTQAFRSTVYGGQKFTSKSKPIPTLEPPKARLGGLLGPPRVDTLEDLLKRPGFKLAEPDAPDDLPEPLLKAMVSALQDYAKHEDADRLRRDLAAIQARVDAAADQTEPALSEPSIGEVLGQQARRSLLAAIAH
jgi:hypothetical protein